MANSVINVDYCFSTSTIFYSFTVFFTDTLLHLIHFISKLCFPKAVINIIMANIKHKKNKSLCAVNHSDTKKLPDTENVSPGLAVLTTASLSHLFASCDSKT